MATQQPPTSSPTPRPFSTTTMNTPKEENISAQTSATATHILQTAVSVLQAYKQHSVALIFVCKRYRKDCGRQKPGVRHVVNNGIALAKILKAQGFRVKLIKDSGVTRQSIEAEIASVIDNYPLQNPTMGRFVLYFGGHGVCDATGAPAFCCHDFRRDREFSTSFLLKDLKERILPRLGLYHQCIFLSLDVAHHADTSIFAGRRTHAADKYVFANHAFLPVVYAITDVNDLSAQSKVQHLAGEKTVKKIKFGSKSEMPQGTPNCIQISGNSDNHVKASNQTDFMVLLCESVHSGSVFDRFQSDYCTLSEIFEATRGEFSSHMRTPLLKDILEQHVGQRCGGEMLFFRSDLTKCDTWEGALKVHRGLAQTTSKTKNSIYKYELSSGKLPQSEESDYATTFYAYDNMSEAAKRKVKAAAKKTAHKAVVRENNRLKDLERYLREQRRKRSAAISSLIFCAVVAAFVVMTLVYSGSDKPVLRRDANTTNTTNNTSFMEANYCSVVLSPTSFWKSNGTCNSVIQNGIMMVNQECRPVCDSDKGFVGLGAIACKKTPIDSKMDNKMLDVVLVYNSFRCERGGMWLGLSHSLRQARRATGGSWLYRKYVALDTLKNQTVSSTNSTNTSNTSVIILEDNNHTKNEFGHTTRDQQRFQDMLSKDCFRGETLWTFATNDYVMSSAAISPDGSRLYFGSKDHRLYSVNAQNGSLIWRYDTQGDVTSSPALDATGTLVFVACSTQRERKGRLYAVFAFNGTTKWTYEMDLHVFSSPAVSNDNTAVYIGGDFYVHAINILDGKKIWKYKTNGIVLGSPLVAYASATSNETIYVGSDDEYLHAIQTLKGSPKWKYKTGGKIQGSPVISDDGSVIYVGSDDKKIHAVYALNGAALWQFGSSAPIRNSPALSADGSTVFIGSGDGVLHAVQASNGILRWRYNTDGAIDRSSAAISTSGRILYVGSTDNKLHAVWIRNGSRAWAYDTGGHIHSSPSLSRDGQTIFVGSNDGRVHAINCSF